MCFSSNVLPNKHNDSRATLLLPISTDKTSLGHSQDKNVILLRMPCWSWLLSASHLLSKQCLACSQLARRQGQEDLTAASQQNRRFFQQTMHPQLVGNTHPPASVEPSFVLRHTAQLAHAQLSHSMHNSKGICHAGLCIWQRMGITSGGRELQGSNGAWSIILEGFCLVTRCYGRSHIPLSPKSGLQTNRETGKGPTSPQGWKVPEALKCRASLAG